MQERPKSGSLSACKVIPVYDSQPGRGYERAGGLRSERFTVSASELCEGEGGPGVLSANEMDVLDVRVSRDHSINAVAS